MKKALIVLAAVLVVVPVLARPASAGVTFDLGVKGGLAMTKIQFSDMEIDLYKSIAKPVFGVFFAFNLCPSFAVQPEIYYLVDGTKIEKSGEGSTYRMQMELAYVHVPVLAKLRFANGGKLRPVVFGGPFVSLLATAKQRYYEDGVLMDENDVKEYLKSTDFGATFGGGLELTLNKLLLVLDVRYNLGLTNIDRESDDTTLKTRGLLVMAGIGF